MNLKRENSIDKQNIIFILLQLKCPAEGLKKFLLCTLRLKEYMTFDLMKKSISLKFNFVIIPTHFGKEKNKHKETPRQMWQNLRYFQTHKWGKNVEPRQYSKGYILFTY